MATALRPAASGIVLMSASTSAPCTILARRARPGSLSPYLTRIDSKEQRPSTCPSSAPSTSNGVASFSFATRPTSRGSTYRNSASASMKRRTSQGHAIRSTAAFLRVTHRMVLCLLALLRQPDRLLRASASSRLEVVAFDRAGQSAPQNRDLAPKAGLVDRPARQAFGRLAKLFVLLLAVLTHPSPDVALLCLRELCDWEHVGVPAALDNVLGDPVELLQQVLAVRQDHSAGREVHRAQPLQAAPRCHPRGARSRRQAPRQPQPPRALIRRVHQPFHATTGPGERTSTYHAP